MKTLLLLQLSIAVALAVPAFLPGVVQNPDLTKEDQTPVQGDLVPVQGHVEVEEPAPQVRLVIKEQQEKLSPVDTEQGQSQSTVELQVKVKPIDKVEQDGKVKTEVKKDPELKVEPDIEKDQEVKENPEVKVLQELKAEPEVKARPQVKVDPEPEVNLNLDLMAEGEVNVKPETETEPELKVEPEVKVEPDVQMEQKQAETETGQKVEERRTDMEGNYETASEPIMELEPLDDHSMNGEEGGDRDLSEKEKTVRMAIQSQDPVIEPLPEEEGLMRKGEDVLDEEPIMELEQEMRNEPLHNLEVMPDAAIMEEGPALDTTEQHIAYLEDYFRNEGARIGMVPEKHLSDRHLFEEPAVEDGAVLDGGAEIGVAPKREKGALMSQGGQSTCLGVEHKGKCYEFFRGPMRAADAEVFCQERFPSGHLASITSQYIHREVMKMMLQQNGAYTRTWIGGIRYLETGNFIWLDGSHWGYDDWLSGEPNDTIDKEDCVELLTLGDGKFNDFTCWEPQAFICSYLYQ